MNTETKLQYLRNNIKRILLPQALKSAECYICGYIPQFVITGAINSYAKVMPNNILALVDTSLKMNGETGMVFTDDGVWIKEIRGSGKYYSYDSFNASNIVRNYNEENAAKLLLSLTPVYTFSAEGIKEVMHMLSMIEHGTNPPVHDIVYTIPKEVQDALKSPHELEAKGIKSKSTVHMRDDGMVIDFDKRGINTMTVYYNNISGVASSKKYAFPFVLLGILCMMTSSFFHILSILAGVWCIFWSINQKITIYQKSGMPIVLYSHSRIDTKDFINAVKQKAGFVL